MRKPKYAIGSTIYRVKWDYRTECYQPVGPYTVISILLDSFGKFSYNCQLGQDIDYFCHPSGLYKTKRQAEEGAKKRNEIIRSVNRL